MRIHIPKWLPATQRGASEASRSLVNRLPILSAYALNQLVCGTPLGDHTEATAAAASISMVVNFVLERSHVLMVDGLPCVTLGHGLADPVVAHPFWGTAAVVDALRRCDGWDSGRVVLDEPLRAPM